MHLGGVVVSDQVGFVAHSDGDVAIHALCDALLGALALGDIGKHFPDNSARWKGIASRILLRQGVGMPPPAGPPPAPATNQHITVLARLRSASQTKLSIYPVTILVMAFLFIGDGDGIL